MKPALAQSIELRHLPRYLEDDKFNCQQKLDGQRVLVEIVDGKVVPFNRNGDPRPAGLPVPIKECLQQSLQGHWALDGEMIGDTYWVFDLLRALEVVSPSTPCAHRLHVLEEFFTVWQPPPCIQVVPRACTAEDKKALAKKVYESGGEGLILRDATRPYHEGRRTSDILKAKFVKTVDAIVLEKGCDGKDNLVLGVYRDESAFAAGEKPIEIAHCTALSGDGAKVQIGDVVEVTYLTWSGTRLVQPTRPVFRTDKRPNECLLSQLQIGATKVPILGVVS